MAYLSIPLAMMLMCIPTAVSDISSADGEVFNVYDTDPRTVHDGPLISGTVDFEITDDVRLRLPKGTPLSDVETYMRLDSEEGLQYRISVNISGMNGFALDCGIAFEFYADPSFSERVSAVTFYSDGTVYTGLSFISNRDYHIRAVTAREAVLDSLPGPVTGMGISFDITIDGGGQTIIEDRTGDKVVDAGEGKANIPIDELVTMLDSDGSMTILIGDVRLYLDPLSVEFLTSKAEDILRIWVEPLESEGGSPFSKVYETHVECDDERITSLGQGMMAITMPYDSGGRGMDAMVRSISTSGRTSVCDSLYDYDSSVLSFEGSGCYMFSIEPYDGHQYTNSNQSNGTGLILALPVAIVVAMILLPLVLKWKGKI